MKIQIAACGLLAIGVAASNLFAPGYPPSIPQSIVLTVRETAGVARNREVLRSGIPIPRALNLITVTNLTIVDSAGTAVPAEFEVLARWNAGRDSNAPVQWLLVTFAASVEAGKSSVYRLVTDGSAGPNPAPATPITTNRSGNQVTVNTGAATFVVGGNPAGLVDEIRLPSGTRLASAGSLTARVNNVDTQHPTTRRVSIEHAGPLISIVVIEGAYDLPAIGGGGLSSRVRYVFSAGSPTAILRHSVNWEGDRCGSGVIFCDGSLNALRVQRVRNTVNLDFGAPLIVTALGSRTASPVQGALAAGQSASIRQQLRASRNAPLALEINVPGNSIQGGAKADAGILSVSGATGALALALNQMHRYEPQALRVLDGNRIAVDIADDQVWLGARQGLFATMALSALGANPNRTDLEQFTWAPLNHPLRAWPEPAWFAASGAVDEFPVDKLPRDLESYDTLVSRVLQKTLDTGEQEGVSGLMTYGLYPRYWGNAVTGNELDCGPDDPTPGESWDNLYWCTTWTDYHSTAATVPVWAFRTGQVEWLDEFAAPAALRMLHTQIMQCSSTDAYFYCGQAPAGYGGYRENFNSSHAYFDNLILYYWLTGDYSVIETLKRGAASMRNYLCSRRPEAVCQPEDPPVDEFAGLTGRVASQWLSVFRVVGLAGDDPSYLGDWRSGMARAVTQWYVEAEQAGTRYGFWTGGLPLRGPGTYSTDQLWMACLYDMNNLYRLQQETEDAPFGNPAVRPSQVMAAWARTLARFGSRVSGDGTAAGAWPNALFFTWTGPRIGGTLISVSANTAGGDPFLYETGKACITAAIVRAGIQSADAQLLALGADLTKFALNAASSDFSPLGKLMGEYLSRTHSAVARLAAAAARNRRRP
jgi:hypothetical protein